MLLSSAVPALAVLAATLSPQDPFGGEVAFQQAVRDAGSDAVVLNLAAHPDDESARTMVLLRHAHGVRTVTAYATCGEGGQNAVGSEIGRRLAAIRARETLLAADRYGTEVRWLGFPDFGYSKTLEETLGVWGRDATAERIAAVIDAVQPDVVVTNHAIDQGHGHHRAVAWAARLACEQRGLPLYRRAGSSEEGAGLFELDPREVDPVRGATYARQAHEAWVLHQSQGPWRPHDPTNVRVDRWRQLVPDPERDAGPPLARLGSVLVDGQGAAELARRGLDLTALRRSFDELAAPDRPRRERVAVALELLPALRDAHRRVESGDVARRLDRRIEALERVAALGEGAQLEFATRAEELPLGGLLGVRVALRGPGASEFTAWCGSESAAVDPETGWAELDLGLPESAAADPLLDLTRMATFRIEARFELGDGVPVRLGRTLAVRIAPAEELRFERSAGYVPVGRTWRRVLSLEVEHHGEGRFEGDVRLRAPAGLEVEAFPSRIVLEPGASTARVLVRVERREAAAGDEGQGKGLDGGPIEILARLGDRARAVATLQPFAVPDELARLRVGLIRGPEDSTERCLADLGVDYEVLDEAGLAVAELTSFTTLFLDIRAYQHRPDLANHRERLLAFVRAGGRVITCYHKEREWNEAPGHPMLAPFALQVGRARVSEEDAAVTLLEPAHPLWNQPFRIGPTDFDGWVQERGLNFPAERDVAWVPLMAMHDTGEEELDGALLHARYGRGDWIHCSLALYRQLRRGHVGAARILANLLGGR